ncbi:MAG: hypothetical protein R3Y12_08380 [Clostridia bacterium]
MKNVNEKKADVFYKAMGEINADILNNVENMDKKTNLHIVKRKSLVAVVACCVLLMGASSTVIKLAGGGSFSWKNSGGYSVNYDVLTGKVFEEREDGLYYIFDDQEINITEYCSAENYFIDTVLDDFGTGYIMVVGGDEGERGYSLSHFERGKFLLCQDDSEIYGVKTRLSATYGNEVKSSFPQLIWNHHAIHFIGYDLTENWFFQEDIIENEYGTAVKIAENMYFVKGCDLDFYSTDEKLYYISNEIQTQVDWLTTKGFSYDDNGVIEVIIYDGLSEEQEKEIRDILDEIGFEYIITIRID